MNPAIKILEKIGQNVSLNQHDNLIEMLQSINVAQHDSLRMIKDTTNEFVCLLIPEDEEGEDKGEDE